MKAEINKDIELVQILLYLSEQQEKTIQCINNKVYTTAISEWFAAYKNHSAVQLTKDLIHKENFIHIRPLQAILSLKDIIANPEHSLYAWGTAVTEFRRTSGFDAFFESQSGYYKWISDHITSCDFDTWVGFIDAYFRQKPDEFRLIVCPLAGNYGFSVEENGKNVAYTVRFEPKYDENGTPDWNFDFFAKGIAHEYAHCFVNPVVEAHVDLLQKHPDFFIKHKDIPNFYNTDYAVINEYFVRAFQIRFMECNHTLFPGFDIEKEYEYQRTAFLFIDRFVDVLQDFEASAVSFSDFYLARIERILAETTEH
ncbi:MAG: DUF4932 domain-containing protein [Lachnospiraceae bacterium]|nr:DUF4932 domain-containing protein [Lachnospiraceae bacterium]